MTGGEEVKLIAGVLLCGTLWLAGVTMGEAKAAPTRYEYRAMEVGTAWAEDFAKAMNADPGWEVVMITQRNGYTTGVVLRRPVAR